MSAIELTRFTSASYKPSKRKTKCKNCDSMFGPRAVSWADGDIISPYDHRIVIWGGCPTRHVSLCPDCANAAAFQLTSLASEIYAALRRARKHTPKQRSNK